MPRSSGFRGHHQTEDRTDGLQTVIQYLIPTMPGPNSILSTSEIVPAWYIDSGGTVLGPISLAELQERAAKGEVHPTDSVSSDRVTWIPAGSIEGLKFPAQPRQPLLETVVSGSVHPVDSTTASQELSPLDPIPGYELEPGKNPLGTGACGVVYRARQLKLDRVVALKTVLLAENTHRDVIARFEQEAVSLARLQHPNIVAVYDCGHSSGRAYFAMELLDGEDLAARLDRTGPLNERTAWLIARQTAAALAHAAKFGIIHRDVKPANLFLVPSPTGFPLPPDAPMVKVTDFGLALMRGGSTENDQRQTAAGVMLGTPVYMAPEQFTGSTVDPRADIYGLGATVFHILTGQPPFDGKTVWEVMMKKSGATPRLTAPISEPTIQLVSAMMASSPNDRPADYAELIARIDCLPCMEGCAFSVTGMMAVPGRNSTPALTLPDPVATSPAKPQAAHAPRRWLYAILAIALLGVGVGVAALSGVFDRPVKEPDGKHATYTLGATEDLFAGSAFRWNGPGIKIEKDEEKPALLIESSATRGLPERPNFYVVLGLDRHQATKIDVVIATADSAQWLVRLDAKEGVAFGKLVQGVFSPVGTTIPYPPQKKDQSPYLELKYERSGGKLTAWFDKQQLGETSDAGLKTTEFRIQTTGGAIHIETAEFAELVEKK